MQNGRRPFRRYHRKNDARGSEVEDNLELCPSARFRFGYPNNSMIGLPVVRVRKIPVGSLGSLIGMSRAW